MKWRIKNPAPVGPRMKTWGDYHFGRSLAKYLERLGEEVQTDYHPEWDPPVEVDVVLTIRGKYPYEPKPGPINILWNISHPEDVAPAEYNKYDLIFVASRAHTERVRSQVIPPVAAMLQCTDTEECYPPDPTADRNRRGFVFVGNSRDVERPGVLWAIADGVPLQIWGNMWNKFVEKHYIMEKNLPGEERGALYRTARMTLNDHWPDMKEFGFVNDRCFDALACGLPLVSDYHEELHQLFPNEVLYYTNRDELRDSFREILLNYPDIKRRVDGLKQSILDEFSFQARAKTFLEAVRQFRSARKPLGG